MEGLNHPSKASLKILQWNVRGLNPDMLTQEVLYVLAKADVIVFTETWLANIEDIPTDLTAKFTCHAACRPYSGRGRPGGGVLVGVRNPISHTLQHTTVAPESVWVSIDQANTNPLQIGGVYLPPSGSTNSLGDPLDWLDLELARFPTDNLILVGDWNARIGELGDSPQVSHPPQEGINLPPPIPRLLGRTSQDHCANPRGVRLVHTCQAAGLHILNGRIPGDIPARFTYAGPQGSSCIDMFAAGEAIISHQHPTKLVVLSHPALQQHSDHHPVALMVPFAPPAIPPAPNPDTPQRKGPQARRWKWDATKKEAYNTTLASTPIIEKLEKLGDLPTEDAFQAFFDTVQEAARSAGLPNPRAQPQKRKLHHTPASTRTPILAVRRQAYLDLQNAWAISRTLRQSNNASPTGLLEAAAREHAAASRYKKLARLAKRRHIAALSARYSDLLQHKPNRFWTLYKRASPTEAPIATAVWMDHFQKLRAAPTPTGDVCPTINHTPPPSGVTLGAPTPSHMPGSSTNPSMRRKYVKH